MLSFIISVPSREVVLSYNVVNAVVKMHSSEKSKIKPENLKLNIKDLVIYSVLELKKYRYDHFTMHFYMMTFLIFARRLKFQYPRS